MGNITPQKVVFLTVSIYFQCMENRQALQTDFYGIEQQGQDDTVAPVTHLSFITQWILNHRFMHPP